MLLFQSKTKNSEVIAEKPFQNCGVTRGLWNFQHATVPERSIEERFFHILSIYNNSAKMPPITFVNAWKSFINTRRQYIFLIADIGGLI